MEPVHEHTPQLLPLASDGLRVWTDERLRESTGVVVAFTERGGGVSTGPYRSLNLAAHVGDDPSAVDLNRDKLMSALGLSACRSRLVTAEQVHGVEVARITAAEAGSGAMASAGRPPIAHTDALITTHAGIPLLMFYADCVPLVLVAPGPALCVVHAGWRGALASLPAKAAREMASLAACDPSDLLVYVGPHVGSCCYAVSEEILSQFVNAFGTLARADSGCLDLEAAVRRSLIDAGVAQWRIASLGSCTADEIHAFYSYRAESGMTGRHGALACIGSCS